MATSIAILTPPSPDPLYYPASLTVTNDDSNTAHFNGEYILVHDHTINEQPIWKKGGNQISYKGGRWTVKNSVSGFRSPETRPEVFPETGWQYKKNSWVNLKEREIFVVEGKFVRKYGNIKYLQTGPADILRRPLLEGGNRG